MPEVVYILEAPPHSTDPKSPDKRFNWEASAWTYEQARKYSEVAIHDCPRLKQGLELIPWVLKGSPKGKQRGQKGNLGFPNGTQSGPKGDPKATQKAPEETQKALKRPQ